jgi:hypothetical protein
MAEVIDTAHVALYSYEANPPLDDALFEPKTEARPENPSD